MGKVEPRSVTPIISTLRNLLLGRKHQSPLRFGDYYAPRTQPPPNLPLGSSNKLADNYYYGRDGRRDVAPPLLLSDSQASKLISGTKEVSSTPAVAPKTPGAQWKWD